MKNAVGTVATVLLLGGRSEIGLAIVRQLVERGARSVVLAVRGGKPDENTERMLRGAGATQVETLDFDVTASTTHESVIARAVELVGDLDVVIDAVGVLGSTQAYENDPAAAAESAVTNFAGHVSVGLAVAAVLRRQGHGTFIVLSSVAGVRVRRANYIYGAAKAGLDGFAQGLGDALTGSGATVMVVRPGFVRTKMTAGLPDGPFPTTPERVARAVVEGLAAGRETVWVPAALGPLFAVLRLLPRAIWRRLPR
ncbi:decaprenylphospho-beta-D-erythro-pentofuranosid-2-ulose 2-reductase [Thermasporomyces composti]|jgi:decaprenylphospho-beta-D-erythro-pentofuranosid-2-ulose 2-reductase|uniref:Decaprenylphospho-beta-D-erythro-pentofuranosid-2-ulose 2-reductase n=1 Tax=Thermasporomyces composti TaxID=696763 RepID=A0A3D9VCK5_THECX|nr:decaprenylphospho-beta-D-erythro-pentofuranosid-2-ulose 2-reductase [Thermasporomyces composti]REF36805.1 decaprenylphospho-beta-D-erythro-pentofuranosid-2-ulose 2-reductase [Thermasporomyces composti]